MGQLIDPMAVAVMTGAGMLGAWALGRVQGDARARRVLACVQAGTAAAERAGGNARPGDRMAIAPDPSAPDQSHPAPSGTDPGPNRVSDERFIDLDHPGALADLHEQANAIRRTERIFDSLSPELVLIDAERGRSPGRIGQPDGIAHPARSGFTATPAACPGAISPAKTGCP